MITLQLQVWGTVQGVGFRYFTKRLADRMKIRGTVANRIDGSVVVIAQGPMDQVYDFVEKVRRSPAPAGRVTRSHLEVMDPSPSYPDFTILL